MASVLDIDDFRRLRAPRWWVDHGAAERTYPSATGWMRSLRAIAEVAYADDDGMPSDARMNWLVSETKKFVDEVRGKPRLVFHLALFATDWLAPLVALKLPPLRRMNWVERIIALKKYESSPLGLSLFAVKAFTSIIWFENPEVAERAGFDGAAMVS